MKRGAGTTWNWSIPTERTGREAVEDLEPRTDPVEWVERLEVVLTRTGEFRVSARAIIGWYFGGLFVFLLALESDNEIEQRKCQFVDCFYNC